MLIHAEGVSRGEAPVKIYQIDGYSGCVLVGDENTRILLSREEISELYKLLEPLVKSHPPSSGSGRE